MSQIAEAAEISESTFFRYFATKEATVLEDDFDAPLAMSLAAQPADLPMVPALRRAVREVFSSAGASGIAELQERTRMIFEVPELRDAMAGRIMSTLTDASRMLAARAGRSPDDFRIRVMAGAMIGAMIGVTMAPVEGGPSGYLERIDAALAELESGISL